MTETTVRTHQPVPYPVYVQTECAVLDCEHEGADTCPTVNILVCAECLRIIEAASPGWSESKFDQTLVSWPCVVGPPIPGDFWGQIDHQLERIKAKKPDTFAKLREILLDPAYVEVQREIHRNGARTFDVGRAFFAGSGGEKTLASALQAAGWELLNFKAPYYFVRQNTRTGRVLTYIEGDVVAGNQIDRKGS